MDPLTGLITGLPDDADAGEYRMRFFVEDAAGERATSEELSLWVQNVNIPPVLEVVADLSTDEDRFFYYQLTASDDDTDTLSFSGVSLPDWLAVSSNGLITGTPTNDDVGSHSVTVEVTDSGGATDQQTFTLTVHNVNDAPELILDPNELGTIWYVASEGEYYSHQLGVNDDDLNDTHVFGYELISFDPFGGGYGDFKDPSTPIWFSLDPLTGLITGLPDDADAGEYRMRFFVEDAAGERATSEELSLWVQNVNIPPVLEVVADLSTDEDRFFYYQLTASDDDTDDQLYYSIVSGPSWLAWMKMVNYSANRMI